MANCRIIIKNYQNNINKKTTFCSSLEEWRMSPIILFDKQSVLNPKGIKLEGAGKLLNLICTASILTRSTYFSVYVFILIFVLENLIIDNNICKNLLCMCIPSKNLSLIINVHVHLSVSLFSNISFGKRTMNPNIAWFGTTITRHHLTGICPYVLYIKWCDFREKIVLYIIVY